MAQPLQPLHEIDPRSLDEVGGKAAGLAVLLRAGLPVPPGFVVPSSALHIARARRPHDALTTQDLPAGWSNAWTQAARELGPLLAVRSSARDEDGEARSFAGVHKTVLGVTPEEVPHAIQAVWASLQDDTARAYRGAGRAASGMAVLVQPMVDAHAAGVLFTVNPATGSWRELVIEAVWGLADPLVSGRVAPHWYLVRRPRRAPWGLTRALTRARLKIIEQAHPPQTSWCRPGDAGVEDTELPDHLRDRPVLDHAGILTLSRLALRVERTMGSPQDIEWARTPEGSFVLLQSRPITAAPAASSPDDVLWTRRFIGERWTGPPTPLGWSLIEPELRWFIGYPRTQARHLGGGAPIRLVEGHPYVNATAFRHLIFKAPGASPPRFLSELLPPDEVRQLLTRFAALPRLTTYGAFLQETLDEQRWERFAFNPLNNPHAWRAFVRGHQHLTHLRVPRPHSPAGQVRQIEAYRSAIRAYIGIHVCSLLYANLTYQALEAGLMSVCPQRAAELLSSLAVSPPGNQTLRANQAMWHLAQLTTPDDLDALQRGEPMGREASEALQQFLQRHGHRAANSWEVFSPRWRDTSHRLVPLLRAQQRISEDPNLRVRQQEANYHQAIRELDGLDLGATGLALLGVAYLNRRYLLLRENQRDWFDRLLEQLQSQLLGAGQGLTQRDLLASATDVQWLTWEETRGLLLDQLAGEPVQGWVDRRKGVHARSCDNRPPTFLSGDEAIPTPQTGPRLEGLGISRGRTRGIARYLRSPNDAARLGPGEVLLTHAVDPSWTPLFTTAGAIITEMGGMLSHGAVVAREYGVPMIVNVPEATLRIRDGDEITVDGSRGTVWVHP